MISRRERRKTLGLIVARGGSKGIPGKNIRELDGRPLIAHTADAARDATRLERIVLSTDSREIADVAEGLGIEVPFLRPAELAPVVAEYRQHRDGSSFADLPANPAASRVGVV